MHNMCALTRSCPQSVRMTLTWLLLCFPQSSSHLLPAATVTPAAWKWKEVVNVVSGIQNHLEIFKTYVTPPALPKNKVSCLSING